MSITLSPETEQLIKERMKEAGFSTADDLVRVALKTLDQVQGEDFDDLDSETIAAIEEAEAQFDRGEARPWEEVREEIRRRFIKPVGPPRPPATAATVSMSLFAD